MTIDKALHMSACDRFDINLQRKSLLTAIAVQTVQKKKHDFCQLFRFFFIYYTHFRLSLINSIVASGAGTNLKVGGGGTDPARSAGNFLLGRAPQLFGSKHN